MKMKTSTLITAALVFSMISLSCEKEPISASIAESPETRSADVSGIPAGDEPEVPGKELLFNPQPEPPARTFQFEAQWPPGADGTGQFQTNAYPGSRRIKTHSPAKRRRTLHLVNSWRFYPAHVHPPHPVNPP